MLAELSVPSLAENMVRINKESQNLHSELMLRRVSRQAGSGSIAHSVPKKLPSWRRMGTDT